jgi:hypothetical protein
MIYPLITVAASIIFGAWFGLFCLTNVLDKKNLYIMLISFTGLILVSVLGGKFFFTSGIPLSIVLIYLGFFVASVLSILINLFFLANSKSKTEYAFYIVLSAIGAILSFSQVALKNYLHFSSLTAYWPIWLIVLVWFVFKFSKVEGGK